MVASAPDTRTCRAVTDNAGLSHICIRETGFRVPETNRPKLPSGQTPSLRRTRCRRESPPMAGFLAASGKTHGS
jgi:hypothetical protein